MYSKCLVVKSILLQIFNLMHKKSKKKKPCEKNCKKKKIKVRYDIKTCAL